MTRTHYDLTANRGEIISRNVETSRGENKRSSWGRKLGAIAFALTSLMGLAANANPAQAATVTDSTTTSLQTPDTSASKTPDASTSTTLNTSTSSNRSSATAEQGGSAFTNNGAANVNPNDTTNSGSNAGSVNGSSTNAYNSVDNRGSDDKGTPTPTVVKPGNTVKGTDDTNHDGSTQDDAANGNHTDSTNQGTTGSGSSETTKYQNTEYKNDKAVKSDTDNVQSKNYKPNTPTPTPKPTPTPTPKPTPTPNKPSVTPRVVAPSNHLSHVIESTEAMPVTGGKGNSAETGGNIAMSAGAGLIVAGVAAYLTSRRRKMNRLNQSNNKTSGDENRQEAVKPNANVVPAMENEANRELAPNALALALAKLALSDEFVRQQLDISKKVELAA